MACVSNDRGGKRRIQFVSPEGSRKAIHLGKISQNGASTICVHVEHLLASKRSGLAVEAKTATWIADLPEWLAKKLVKVGLIDKPEAKATVALGTFIDEYIECRSDIKARTAERLRQAKAKMVECFGSAKPLRQFTTADADRFRQWLVNQGLAENTVRRLCGRAKQFFRAAMRRKLIVENPFADLVSAVRGNPGRLYFVTRQEASEVLDACPDAEWRLLFALARFGGLRTPSESLALKWVDMDWANGRIRVPSPKTEHI